MTSKTPPEVSKLLNTIEPDSSSSKNYSRISSYKLYKWQINTKNDHIMVMNAIVFCKIHGNGYGNGKGKAHGNNHDHCH